MKAVVSLSGGQDSATCLYFAKAKYDEVEAVSFDYGQTHRVELDCARDVALGAGVEQTVIPVPALSIIGGASLTDASINPQMDARGTGNEFAAARGLPSSFVPGRNIILLGTAAAFALTRGADVLVTGICQEDDAGYPDCRNDFRAALEDAIALGTDTPNFVIEAPLMDRSKADTWALAAELGIVHVIVRGTHTCYRGVHDTLHDWGYGCGTCPACLTRAAGYTTWLDQERVSTAS